VVGLLQLAVQSLQYQMFLGADILVVSMLPIYIPKWFFLSRIFWFPLGIVAGFNSKLLVSWLERYRIWLFCLALALIPLGMWEWQLYYQWSGVQWLDHFETLTDSLYSLAVIFGVLSLDLKKLPFLAEIRLVGSMSYGIYLVHSLIIEYFARTIYHVLPQILGYQIVFQPLVIVAGLGVPLFLMFLVNCSVFRSGYAYLFG
jgi:membrane-bound acyltransferase YfiQ involved in biofilm formation